MKKEERLDKEKRLDELARDWKTTPADGNEARLSAIQAELGILACELYYTEASHDAFQDAFVEAYSKYDPEKGPFSHYFSLLLNRRKKDAKRRRGHDSLDAPLSTDEETEQTLGDTLPAKAGGPEDVLLAEAVFAELTSMVLNFSENHTGRQANETRRMWYKIFFTEDVTHAYKTQTYAFSHERDIFRAMLLPYLDYYMAAQCRAGNQVSFTPLKPYGEVVPGRRGETGETPVPLPADVSLAWLRHEGVQAGASARSNQRRSYEAEKREMRRS